MNRDEICPVVDEPLLRVTCRMIASDDIAVIADPRAKVKKAPGKSIKLKLIPLYRNPCVAGVCVVPTISLLLLIPKAAVRVASGKSVKA